MDRRRRLEDELSIWPDEGRAKVYKNGSLSRLLALLRKRWNMQPAQLMNEYNPGVFTINSYEIKGMNSGYFVEYETADSRIPLADVPFEICYERKQRLEFCF